MAFANLMGICMLYGLSTGWSIYNRTILNFSHFLARRYFSNPFSPKWSIHIGKLSQQHWFVMASFVILVWCHFVSPYNWAVQQITFCVEVVISGKSLG